MKVEYLFSRSPRSIASKAIAWASSKEGFKLEKYPSHMAVLIDSTMVVESTFLTGIRIIPYSHWLKTNEELYRIPCATEHRDGQDTLNAAFKLWGKNYDWMGILFFAWRFLGLIILDRPMPGKNHWQNKNRYFCCEYAGSLTGEDFSMKSPARICNDWLEAAK